MHINVQVFDVAGHMTFLKQRTYDNIYAFFSFVLLIFVPLDSYMASIEF